MGWQNLSHLYLAEPLEHQRIRVLDEVEPVEIDYTLPTDRADDHEPVRVDPLLRGPVQPAAPSAAGPTGNAGPRKVSPRAGQQPDPTHHADAA